MGKIRVLNYSGAENKKSMSKPGRALVSSMLSAPAASRAITTRSGLIYCGTGACQDHKDERQSMLNVCRRNFKMKSKTSNRLTQVGEPLADPQLQTAAYNGEIQ